MGHEGMAAAAVRYLRSVGAATSSGPLQPTQPPPSLRAVRPGERAPGPCDREFRRVLGHFASGVTIVTAPGDDGNAPAGFACQSFSSLSLDPPLVAFLVGRTSTTWPRIARAGVFCANVLSAGQGELCRGFAVRGGDKFAGVRWDPAPVTGSPRLSGCLAWIDCSIHAVHTGGDHLIVVGRVVGLDADGDGDGDPLLFYRGGFGGFSRPGH